MNKKKLRFVSKYPVKKYRCGLMLGDRVMLRKRVVVKDHLGKPTGKVWKKGEIWSVLQGTKGVVWFRRPDGEVHTWDDDQSVYEVVKKIVEKTS